MQTHAGSRLLRLPDQCCAPAAEPARRASQHWGRQQPHPEPSAGLCRWQQQSSAARPQSRHQCGSGPRLLPAQRPCSRSGRLRHSSRAGSLEHTLWRPCAKQLAPAARLSAHDAAAVQSAWPPEPVHFGIQTDSIKRTFCSRTASQITVTAMRLQQSSTRQGHRHSGAAQRTATSEPLQHSRLTAVLSPLHMLQQGTQPWFSMT